MYEKPLIAVLICRVNIPVKKFLYKLYARPKRAELLRKRPKSLAISSIILLLCGPEKFPRTWQNLIIT